MDYVSNVKMTEINEYIWLNFAFFLAYSALQLTVQVDYCLTGLCKYTYKQIQEKKLMRMGRVDEGSIWNNKFRFFLNISQDSSYSNQVYIFLIKLYK